MLPSRKALRLTGSDYSASGAYFITICCLHRQHLLGRIEQGQCRLSALGHLAAQHLRKLASYYSNVALDCFVVMPNHLHAILLIYPNARPDSTARQAAKVGSVVGCYKGGVLREAKQLELAKSSGIWQPRFNDHIIRHERALERIREYVTSSPQQWELDRENDQHKELNPFYAWLEAYTKSVEAEERSA
jgi:putative transposase